MATSRSDMTGWYSRKDIDSQYQIKAGRSIGRQSGWQRTINVGKYMELKVVYRQHRKAIEEKGEYKQNHFHDYNIITTSTNLDDNYAVKMTIEKYTQARHRPDEHNPPQHNKLFIFLVQHYPHRLQHIFKQAGASPEDDQQVPLHFDRKCGNHFTRPNRRTLQTIRATQAPEEQQRDLQRISQHTEMQPMKRIFSKPEKQPETEENLDDLEARSTTRASGSTSFKRKNTEEKPETKKHQASTILNFYNATINTHSLATMSASPTMTPRKKDDSTVQSTQRTT
eukprot:1631828-Amphidinium_carterae.1